MSDKDSRGQGEVLSAVHVLEYPYRRSLGPVLGRFLTGLRDGKVEGIRTESGKVMVPPAEYDPETGGALSEFVAVGDAGVVTTWAWQNQPQERHTLDRPFAWALVQLDGADTAMLHMVDASDASAMSSGMRVKARWKAEREGMITDIECFIPEASS